MPGVQLGTRYRSRQSAELEGAAERPYVRRDECGSSDGLTSPLRVAGEDWRAAIAYAVAAFHRPHVQQVVFQETLLPGLPAGERDPSLAPDDGRTGWHFTFLSLPNLPELLLAGRERPFWTYFAILVVNSGSCGEAEFEACQVAGSLPVQRGAGPVGL